MTLAALVACAEERRVTRRISSTSYSRSRHAPYCAAKAGLVQLTRVMAVELARYHIQVNALCPGYFLTPMNEAFFTSPRGRELVEQDIPLRRLGDPAELGPTVVYLASEASSFMTGAVILIDGRTDPHVSQPNRRKNGGLHARMDRRRFLDQLLAHPLREARDLSGSRLLIDGGE